MTSMYTTTLPPHVRPQGPVQAPVDLSDASSPFTTATATATTAADSTTLLQPATFDAASSTELPIAQPVLQPLLSGAAIASTSIDDAGSTGGDLITKSTPPTIVPHSPPVIDDGDGDSDGGGSFTFPIELPISLTPNPTNPIELPISTNPVIGTKPRDPMQPIAANPTPFEPGTSPIYDPAINGPANQNPVKSPIGQIAPHSPPVTTALNNSSAAYAKALSSISDTSIKAIAARAFQTGYSQPLNMTA